MLILEHILTLMPPLSQVHSCFEDWLDPRIAACNLLQMLGRSRLKDTLPRFLPQLQKLMDDYDRAPAAAKVIPLRTCMHLYGMVLVTAHSLRLPPPAPLRTIE